MTRANKKQIGGRHYKGLAIQPWDYIDANGIPYLEGSAIKYLTRWRDKDGLADLRKAIHFIEKRIELEEIKGGRQRRARRANRSTLQRARRNER